ncbi:hypothetical protein XELAEV_18009620mg [Xenopus laevis]|uniref:C3H1-type domain-containing protein n=1 Tax=Xenopus laevis TaxID=8355 RepID=A0A974I0L5_XENLA|nr:hypothetical protein XELAEV_18009620mg [Xenopus laevis]
MGEKGNFHVSKDNIPDPITGLLSGADLSDRFLHAPNPRADSKEREQEQHGACPSSNSQRFNIEKFVKCKEHRKEEDEYRGQYRLIPRTFGNWMQAFAILASILGEKHPEQCLALFCYLDGIWDAQRVYEARTAVESQRNRVWMWVMNNKGYQGYAGAGDVGSQPFPGSSSRQSTSLAGAQKRGVCWSYNDSQCKWGASCRFRHECSGCAGAHPVSKCYKKHKSGYPKPSFGKGGDTLSSCSSALHLTS